VRPGILALGVDGGNTKTLAAVADGDGRVLGTGRSGCSDLYGAPSPAAALAAIEAAAGAALTAAGCDAAAVASAAFSLAGADWSEDFALLERELPARLGLGGSLLVVNDAVGALRAGSPDWTGIAVVCGTYNAVGARHPDGRIFHLGFWPDGAGGRHLGRAGLKAVQRAALGVGPPTVLAARALALYQVQDEIALLHAFTRRDNGGKLGKADEDRFAPPVLDAADDGDAVARAIVEDIGRVLGLQARASAERLGLPLAGTRAVLAGGVLSHPTDRLAGAVMAQLPGAVPVRHGPPPIAGAVALALDRLGVAADAEAVAAGVAAIEEGGAAWAASVSSA
jgi:N-acetylglucosamine kinase-like BadF-type ATPase